MTTTACDDQFSAEPEPVHQPYDVAAILRKNIADLEKELQRQREQNAAATERLRDEVNGLTGSLDRAEKALKEAQEQEPVAWLCGKDVTTHKEYAEWFMRFTQEDCTQLYARPVPAAPAVAVPAVPDEWREVLRECADDLAIELDQRYGDSRKYPSEQRKYEAEMQPVYRARSLLQSTGDKK